MNRRSRFLALTTLLATSVYIPALHAGAPSKELPPALASVLEQYGKIQAALASDTLTGVADAAQAIAKTVTADAQHTVPAEVGTQAAKVAAAKDLDTTREAFKSLSTAVTKCLKAGKFQTGKFFAMHCPMADADWLQTDKAIKNPYFGKGMLGCGEVTATY